MKQEDYKFFQDHGYVSLGKILTNQELEFYSEIFEPDWSEAKDFWREFGHHQTINCDVLVSSPEVDGIIRHPRIIWTPASGILEQRFIDTYELLA